MHALAQVWGAEESELWGVPGSKETALLIVMATQSSIR